VVRRRRQQQQQAVIVGLRPGSRRLLNRPHWRHERAGGVPGRSRRRRRRRSSSSSGSSRRRRGGAAGRARAGPRRRRDGVEGVGVGAGAARAGGGGSGRRARGCITPFHTHINPVSDCPPYPPIPARCSSPSFSPATSTDSPTPTVLSAACAAMSRGIKSAAA
jgi:hypothetical protein